MSVRRWDLVDRTTESDVTEWQNQCEILWLWTLYFEFFDDNKCQYMILCTTNSPALSFTSPHLGPQNRDPTIGGSGINGWVCIFDLANVLETFSCVAQVLYLTLNSKEVPENHRWCNCESGIFLVHCWGFGKQSIGYFLCHSRVQFFFT